MTPVEPWVKRAAEVASDASRDASTGLPCAACGQTFQPVRKHQRFCRPSCRKTTFRTTQLELKKLHYIEPDPGRPE
jgi:hypothetical protein